MAKITLRPLTEADLDLVHGWFGQPHVRAFWGTPEKELAAVKADLAGTGSGFTMLIASVDGAPFAYLQHQPTATAPDPYYADAPLGAQAIDLLIGPLEHLGKGLAAPLLDALAAHLTAQGTTALLLDPDIANTRALKAYRRAGFTDHRRWEQIQVMIRPL